MGMPKEKKPHFDRVCMGHGKPKWKVVWNFVISFSRPGKSSDGF